MSQPPVKRSKVDATDRQVDTSEIVKKPSSHDRRHRLFAAGQAKGFEEGTEFGRSQGLTEGIKEGAQSAASEVASLKKQLSDSLEQSNGIATENLIVTQTAAGLVVELQRERNLVAAQTVELVNLKRINEEQARELAVLRSASDSFLGLSSSASATRPGSSPYLKSHLI